MKAEDKAVPVVSYIKHSQWDKLNKIKQETNMAISRQVKNAVNDYLLKQAIK